MYQLRKVSVCQKSSIRDISFALGHYDIIFPNYNEVREEICRLYSFYYGDNKEKLPRTWQKRDSENTWMI